MICQRKCFQYGIKITILFSFLIDGVMNMPIYKFFAVVATLFKHFS